MSWVSAAHRGNDAERLRIEQKKNYLIREKFLVNSFGKFGFIISWIESYASKLESSIIFPIEIIVYILKMLVFDNDHTRTIYFYLGRTIPRDINQTYEGKMLSSPFRFNMIRFSPYINSYRRPPSPMHDLSMHNYTLVLRSHRISLQTVSKDQKKSSDFKVELDLTLVRKDIELSLQKILVNINCFEQFKVKLMDIFDVTDIILYNNDPYHRISPDILDPRNDFYKMRQLWGVIYTVRGMIDFPL